MRYLLTAIICLWSAVAWAFPPGFLAVATSGSGSLPVCDTTNDGTIDETAFGHSSTDNFEGWIAYKFSTTGARATGIFLWANDGARDVSLVGEIYSDTGTQPNTIYAAGATATISNVVDSPNQLVALEFSSSVTLPSGDYWAVYKASGANLTWGLGTGSGTVMYSTNSGATWTATAWRPEFGVLGCEP